MITFNSATRLSPFTAVATSILVAAAGLAASAQQTSTYVLRGPAYTVTFDDSRGAGPVASWRDQPAGERLKMTTPTTAYLLGDDSEEILLLAWGDGGVRYLDAAYTEEDCFREASAAVRRGEAWVPCGPRDDSTASSLPAQVSVSGRGHTLVFTFGQDGVRATDNGRSVIVTEGATGYRVYGSDYEAGVSLRGDRVYSYITGVEPEE